MKIVTGATGFLGPYVVCHLLEKGHRVRALKRSTSSLKQFDYVYALHFADAKPAGTLEWAEADVLDVPSLEQAFEAGDEVFHCAATVSFAPRDRDLMMQVNVEGTANVVNTALAKKVRALCYVSSIAALGREKPGDEISEETHWADSKHNSNYAISKYKAELEVWRGIEEGLHAVIVNPGVILGAGDWSQGSCQLFEMMWKEMPFYTTGVNGYVDVRDVASAMLLLTEQERYGERYILVSENTSFQHLFGTGATLLGKKKPTIRINRLLAAISWRAFALRAFLTGRKPAITKETAYAALNTFYYSNRKIREQAGFTFIPLQQTLEYICQKFKEDHT